jgi:glucose/arabinose dehydrogenase
MNTPPNIAPNLHSTRRRVARITVLGLAFILLAALVPLGRGQGAERSYLPVQTYDPPRFQAIPLGQDFNLVTSITHAGDDRLFIAERAGRIKILHPDGRITVFLDITNQVISSRGEYGFFDVAFHPGYTDPNSPGYGLFYVIYTTGYDIDFDNRDVRTILSRFRVSSNPDVADRASETIIMREKQSFDVHKGGGMDFDKRNNMLYVGVGEDRLLLIAQDSRSPKGKVVRFDVDRVPSDFVGDFSGQISDEIWAYGLRNPWRIDVDELGNNIYVGEVGDQRWEEVNLVPLQVNGYNYGWPCMEGPERIPEANDIPQCQTNFQPAIDQYPHRDGLGRCAVIGGKVYRPAFNINDNRFIFGDMCTREVFSLLRVNGVWERTPMARLDTLALFSTFGEDRDGTLYLGTVADNGPIYRLNIP